MYILFHIQILFGILFRVAVAADAGLGIWLVKYLHIPKINSFLIHSGTLYTKPQNMGFIINHLGRLLGRWV